MQIDSAAMFATHNTFARITSTARVSLRKHFIPGCVGRGLDLDLRIRPAPAPAASGNPSGWAQAGPKWVGPGYTDLAPLGLRSKNKVFERPG